MNMKLLLSSIVLACACLCMTPTVGADALNWTGTTDNDWYTATNWNPSEIPDFTDDLTVNSGSPTASSNVILANNASGSLTIDGGDVLWAGRFNVISNVHSTGLLTLVSGSLTQSYTGTESNQFKIASSSEAIGTIEQLGGSLSANRPMYLSYSFDSKGTYRISGGNLDLGGGLIATDDGTGSAIFEYSGASATVNVTGDYDADTPIYSSIFNMDGAARTIIPVSGDVFLDGSTLQLELVPGASIAADTTYTLFSAGGNLSAADLNLVYDPADWTIAVTEGIEGNITATAVRDLISIPGDANKDGIVNEVDAGFLADNWLATGVGWAEGDFNNDNVVDDKDATILATNWQHSSTASVPEPGTCVLLIGILLGCLAWNHRAV